VLDTASLTFGKVIGEGANGTVCLGTACLPGNSDISKVAIKTIKAKGKEQVQEALKEFELEARISYKAGTTCRQGQRSRLSATMGIASEAKGGNKVVLHLIMHRVDTNGDLHDAVIHSDGSWRALREDGRDTGARAGRFGKVDDDATQDAWSYSLARSRKLAIAREMALALRELQELGLLHLDIKPANILCSKDDTVTLIDFGEGFEATEDGELGYSCGTPGYMAPEVGDYGVATFASDIYSTGVSLLELWCGHLWEGGEEEEEMAQERAAGLRKVEAAEPKVALLIRACLSEEPGDRPTAKQLLKSVKELQEQAGALVSYLSKTAPPRSTMPGKKKKVKIKGARPGKGGGKFRLKAKGKGKKVGK